MLIPAVQSFNEESVPRFTAYTQTILIYYMKNICATNLRVYCPFFRDKRMKYAVAGVFRGNISCL